MSCAYSGINGFLSVVVCQYMSFVNKCISGFSYWWFGV